ncbi:MAG: leucyl/phenylalanyl-tRNA--protein transferase [Myxococcota bacterium]
MPVFALDEDLVFPHPELADPSGLLAVGGDLRPERLLLGYRTGIFPWYDEGMPLLWHSPDPRMVLHPRELHVGRSLRKHMRRRPYTLRFDTAFRDVITACASVPRPGQNGTWLTEEMIEAYVLLHDMGYAHSAEAWRDGELVGGLYGVSLGGMFFGESMFARADDASKIAFVATVRQLRRWGVGLVDCQVYTEHLARFGAREIPRHVFLGQLRDQLDVPTRPGLWSFDGDPYEPPA